MHVHPVLHLHSVDQALHQTEVLASAGATSMFLIDHLGHDPLLLWNAAVALRARWPQLELGVNQLRGPLGALDDLVVALGAGLLDTAPELIWCDDARGGAAGVSVAQAHLRARRAAGLSATYFGGVAFKYTPTYTDDPAVAAAEAVELAPYVDVVTTSGAGTNIAADPAKPAAISAVLGTQRLAVASGVSATGLVVLAPWVTDVLVASSIETEPYSGTFVPARVRELLAAAAEL